MQSFSVSTRCTAVEPALGRYPDVSPGGRRLRLFVSSPKAGAYQLLMFSPTTGAERAVSPNAVPPSEDGDQARTPDTDSGFFISPEGTTLTVLIDGPSGCLASYSLPTAKLLWRTAPDPNNTAIPVDLTSETAVEGGRLPLLDQRSRERPLGLLGQHRNR